MKTKPMLKKLSALFLSLCIISTMLVGISLPVAAATSGYYTYTVSNGKATITDCSTSISGAVTIPSTLGGYPVTSIGSSAFSSCSSLTSITIPDSVTSIGDYAFYYCDDLTGITIPDSVTSIGRSTFYNCSSLTSITIPDSVTSIGDYAFRYCSSLTIITLPFVGSSRSASGTYDAVFGYIFGHTSSSYSSETTRQYYSSYSSNYYYIPSSLKSVIITDATQIPYGAFYNCSSLTSITIPASVTSIGDSAFYNCSSLTSITIPDSVTSIGRSAFSSCSSLTSITIPDSVTSIGDYAFYYCDDLTGITIPDSVTSIGDSAFYNCSSLTSITIPDSVTSIGRSAFSSCSSLTSVTIPDSVTSIGSSAFSSCSSLTSITIPDSVTSIGPSAFSDCYSLASITIPDSVTSIGSNAFYNCRSLTSITIPDSVTSIGYRAFSTCRSLSSIIVDSENKHYDSRENCNAIIETSTNTLISGCKNTIIPDSVTSIGSYAFYNCSSLTSIIIPDSVTSIGNGAFSDCSSLTSVTIPDSVTIIGSSAFSDCDSLASITIPDSVTSIGSSAFSDCDSLASITIPDSVTSIGDYAFRGCSSLEKITLPFVGNTLNGTSNTHFGYIFGALDYETNKTYVPSSLKEIVITKATSIGEKAFYNCRYLKSVTIPDSVTSIGEKAFYNCRSLTSITIPDSVTSIVEHAFFDCSSLTSITIPDSVTSIGKYAFSGCISLKKIYYAGTNSQWDAISKTNSGIPSSAKIYYNHPGHNYEMVVVDPTCTAKGYTKYTCSLCGDSYTEDEVAAYGHFYDDGVITEPTCTAQGYTTYTCSICGDSYTEDEVAAYGHFYDDGIVTSPTCITKGYTTYTCLVCGDSYMDDEVETTSHSYDKGVVTPPAATTQGYTTYTCTVCGYSYKANYTDATGTVNGVQNLTVTPSDTNIVVSWDAFDGATQYIFYLKDGEGNTLITRGIADTSVTSYTLSWPKEIEWDKNYVVGVRVRTTKWLDTVYKDAALVVGSRIVDVKTQSVGRTIKVDWRAYEGATQYYVYVYEKGAYPTTVTSVRATTNSATIINAINPEVDYEVRVIATKGVAKMATADALSIDARLNVFTPDTFTERGITPTKVGIGFDEVRGADKYWVYLTDVNSGTEIIKESTRAIAAVGSLAPNTEYTVQIQARIVDADGKAHYSGKSAVLGTIKTSDWEDIGFTATSTSSGASLTWNAPENAYGYVIYRSTNGGKSYKGLAAITDPYTTSYVDTNAKSGYMYAIVMQLQDDFVAAKSYLIKSNEIIK